MVKLVFSRIEGGRKRFIVSDLLGNKSDASLTLAYARVSSHDQKKDLERQAMVLKAYCARQGWSIEIIKDLGSGINYKKKALIRLIKLICTYIIDYLFNAQLTWFLHLYSSHHA